MLLNAIWHNICRHLQKTSITKLLAINQLYTATVRAGQQDSGPEPTNLENRITFHSRWDGSMLQPDYLPNKQTERLQRHLCKNATHPTTQWVEFFSELAILIVCIFVFTGYCVNSQDMCIFISCEIKGVLRLLKGFFSIVQQRCNTRIT